MVMAERGMRQHKRLHGGGVFFEQVDDARIRVDDDLVGKTLPALAVECFVAHELLAERPMPVKQRHARRGVGVEHLLGRDDFDPGPVDVELHLAVADGRDAIVDPGKRIEVPVGALEQGLVFRRLILHAAPAEVLFRSNSSRNTG